MNVLYHVHMIDGLDGPYAIKLTPVLASWGMTAHEHVFESAELAVLDLTSDFQLGHNMRPYRDLDPCHLIRECKDIRRCHSTDLPYGNIPEFLGSFQLARM